MYTSERRIATSVLVISREDSACSTAGELAGRRVCVLAGGQAAADGWIRYGSRITAPGSTACTRSARCRAVRTLDPALQVNRVWSGPGPMERKAVPPDPRRHAALMREVTTAGNPVE